MIIIGAGMAGLLAGQMLSRRHKVELWEAQNELPNNHSAVLRFRSPVVGDTLGIPFKKVRMSKATLSWKNNIADAMAYSHKNTGRYLSGRSLPTVPVSADRYIAPSDLISQMANGLHISFGKHFVFSQKQSEPVISTIPMPALMTALSYEDRETFHAEPVRDGINVRANIMNCDAYVSLYVPHPKYPFSRISITGDELICEGAHPAARSDLNGDLAVLNEARDLAVCAAELMGIQATDVYNIEAFTQKYQKITPIDEGVRKRFIVWATDKHGIFSLGRYATWRPSILLDDLVKDVRNIERWASDKYQLNRAR